ncbi:MAG: VWA domain-containing protein [Clostridiales bacterium]|nr:VWA domain-containing protein [Clostridiales bacterium]
MSHFQIEFVYPWLLLLLIPALFLALFPYFRLEKKFRRTRNRITSLVLHIFVSVLCIFVLAGMTFSYDTENANNELMIVADCSFSGAKSNDKKAELIHSIIEEHNENYKVGVVTFGYNQVYAAPLDYDGEIVYNNYINSEKPDDSATDIASALLFARDKLTNPKTAKIVVLSDGVETDRHALDVIRSIAADGVQVNAAYFENENNGDEMQIIDAIMPDANPGVDVAFKIGFTVQSSVVGNAELRLFDNNKEVTSVDVAVESGMRDYYLDCKFDVGGMHILRAEIAAAASVADGLTQNNSYYTYINVESFNKVLILEHEMGESERLSQILTDGDSPYDVTVLDIKSEDLPSSVDALREYDQVILNNIANADMPEGFVEKLNSYVLDFGGGLFTVGGDKIEYGEKVPNAYDVDDMKGTLYQDMLPVQVINYTPPVAVIIIIDKSGSMKESSSSSGQSRIDAAKDGARSAIDALTSRDYCGIMTLSETFDVEQSLLPVTQYERLKSIIDGIDAEDVGTYYTPSIERAGRILSGENRVERKHIILVTDGAPNDNYASYSAAIRRNTEQGITFSIVSIDKTSNADLKKAAEEDGNGRFYSVEDTDHLVDKMRQDLNVSEIKGVNYEDFVPGVNVASPIAAGINPALIPTLSGFYGTRAKADQSVIVGLAGKYVPIFAQWQYGEGKVGSFMCDLSGSDWSNNFMSDNIGKQLIRNMIKTLMPTRSIHAQDIDVGFEEDNYTTNISVFTTISKGEKLRVSIAPLSENGIDDVQEEILTPDAQSGYSRIRVAITKPGVHKVVVNKLDAQNNVIGSYAAYRAFSYSKEYDLFYDADAAETVMKEIAELGGGEVITGAWQLFVDPTTYTHHVINPRLVFIIISIILFLLDIAARKFKWKWIHELVREHKAKKAAEEG